MLSRFIYAREFALDACRSSVLWKTEAEFGCNKMFCQWFMPISSGLSVNLTKQSAESHGKEYASGECRLSAGLSVHMTKQSGSIHQWEGVWSLSRC